MKNDECFLFGVFFTNLGFCVFFIAVKGKSCLTKAEDPEIYRELTN